MLLGSFELYSSTLYSTCTLLCTLYSTSIYCTSATRAIGATLGYTAAAAHPAAPSSTQPQVGVVSTTLPSYLLHHCISILSLTPLTPSPDRRVSYRYAKEIYREKIKEGKKEHACIVLGQVECSMYNTQYVHTCTYSP